MRTLLPILFLLLVGSTFVACGGPVEEAKEENQEKFDDTVLEDDANFAVDFANYFMFTDSLSSIILERSNNEQLKEFATALQSDHQQLYSQLRSIANTADIELPSAISSDYDEFIEDLRDDDETDEVAESYLEKIIELHKTFNQKAEEKIANAEFSSFLDFARNVSSQQFIHQNLAEELLDTIDT